MSDFYICPTCGNEVPVGSRACAICRKKEKKRKPRRKKRHAVQRAKLVKRSWEQDEVYDGLDLPNDDFDYEEFCAKEFGHGPAHKQLGIRWYWWLTALLLLGFFMYFAGAHLFFLW